MRYLLLSSVLMLAGVVTVASAEPPAVPTGVVVGVGGVPRAAAIQRTVYLDHVVLEELKKSNPQRYAQVRAVMASASELCRPNAARQWHVANVDSASCSSMVLKTSYPPKREIGFQIDDTWYVAHIVVRDLPPLRIGAPDNLIPLDQTK